MDSVYGRFNQTCSAKTNIKECLTEFSNIVKPVYLNLMDSQQNEDSSILKLMQVDLTTEEIELLKEYCSEENLTVPGEIPKLVAQIPKKSKFFKTTVKITEDTNLETIRKLQESKKSRANYQFKYSSELFVSYDNIKKLNINPSNFATPYEDILIDVRIYEPFMHSSNLMKNNSRTSKKLVLKYVVTVLGKQMLTDLRDKIKCLCDLTIPIEVSDNPDQPLQPMAKDIYKSGFFYIEETFYNDFRDPANIDYSSSIIEWAKSKNLGPFRSAQMENVRIDSLSVRFGYPWVYQHQGSCEHIIVFSDARLLQPCDELNISEYPRISRVRQQRTIYCYMCGTLAAKWITKEHNRVPHNPCYFCKTCFKSYNYIGGKKIGHFKAYRYPYDLSIAGEEIEPDNKNMTEENEESEDDNIKMTEENEELEDDNIKMIEENEESEDDNIKMTEENEESEDDIETIEEN